MSQGKFAPELLEEIAALTPVWRANRETAPERAYGTAGSAVLGPEDWEGARAEISTWPGYRPTPLAELPGLAAALGIARLAVKDEGGRFGLGSFKALGGAYAVLRQLRARVAAETGETPTTEDLLAGRFAKIAGSLTVCCATDGNHGRSVAWGAKTFGLPCVIYLHERVSAGREAAIARFGAEIRRFKGTYDDSVHQAAEDAAKNGWTVVSDTSYEGYREIPRDVMAGYAVMAAEALEQWGERAANPRFRAGRGRRPGGGGLRLPLGDPGRPAAALPGGRAGQGRLPLRQRGRGQGDDHRRRSRHDHGRSWLAARPR